MSSFGLPAQALPDALRGEQWAFVQLPLGQLKEMFKKLEDVSAPPHPNPGASWRGGWLLRSTLQGAVVLPPLLLQGLPMHCKEPELLRRALHTAYCNRAVQRTAASKKGVPVTLPCPHDHLSLAPACARAHPTSCYRHARAHMCTTGNACCCAWDTAAIQFGSRAPLA